MGERDKRIHANDESPRNTGEGKAPQGPDPDTLEGPGGRGESKGEEDARNKATRRGER